MVVMACRHPSAICKLCRAIAKAIDKYFIATCSKDLGGHKMFCLDCDFPSTEAQLSAITQIYSIKGITNEILG
jgi:hypothetical protein